MPNSVYQLPNMEPLYVFLILNDVWIYILSVLGLFWFINEFVRSRRILRRAMFGLEREKGTRLRNNSLAFIIVFAADYRHRLLRQRANQTYPVRRIIQTAYTNAGLFCHAALASPTSLSTAEIAAPQPQPPLIPTITLASQPGAAPPPAVTMRRTPERLNQSIPPTPPGPTVTPFIGCNVDLNISEPRNGAAVSGSITFSGTADFEDFLSLSTSSQWARNGWSLGLTAGPHDRTASTRWVSGQCQSEPMGKWAVFDAVNGR